MRVCCRDRLVAHAFLQHLKHGVEIYQLGRLVVEGEVTHFTLASTICKSDGVVLGAQSYVLGQLPVRVFVFQVPQEVTSVWIPLSSLVDVDDAVCVSVECPFTQLLNHIIQAQSGICHGVRSQHAVCTCGAGVHLLPFYLGVDCHRLFIGVHHVLYFHVRVIHQLDVIRHVSGVDHLGLV